MAPLTVAIAKRKKAKRGAPKVPKAAPKVAKAPAPRAAPAPAPAPRLPSPDPAAGVGLPPLPVPPPAAADAVKRARRPKAIASVECDVTDINPATGLPLGARVEGVLCPVGKRGKRVFVERTRRTGKVFRDYVAGSRVMHLIDEAKL